MTARPPEATQPRSRLSVRSVLIRSVMAVVLAGTLSVLLGNFRAGQLSLYLSLAVLAVSLDLVWGYAGILSLGQLLPFGTAAYVTARLTIYDPSLSPLALLVSMIVGAALAAGIGAAAFRRRLSIVVVALLTLMLSLTFEQIAEQWRYVTGGFNGLTDVPRIKLAGWTLSDSSQDVVITVIAVVVIASVGALLTRPIGAVLIGIRDNERRMEALGYDTIALKIWVFGLGGAVAGVGGWLYIHRTGFVSPGIFGFVLATNVVLWTLVGGRGTVLGPVIGTLVINFASATLADEWLQYWVLATGAVFIAAVILVPEGLLPWLRRITGRSGRVPHSVVLRRRDQPMAGSSIDAPLPRGLASSQGAQRAQRERVADAVAAPLPPVLEAIDIDKSFGSFQVLDGVTLRMDQPGLCCLIGPNGAGKTTLLNILSGQSSCDGGSVRILGEDFTGRRAWQFARGGVSRKFQAPHVIDSLSIGENLALAGLANNPTPWSLTVSPWMASVSGGTLKILERTGLSRSPDAPAGSLSHGEKQWLEIAMAMALDCQLLLLDEPTAGMTPAESLSAAALLREVHSAERLPIIIVEHDMAFIRAVADRVTVLSRGALLADGPVSQIEANPQVRAVYLGSMQ